MKNKTTVYLLLITSLILAFLVYQPGLTGPFIFDDKPNIVDNRALHIDRLGINSVTEAAFSMGDGVSARPISMSSFAANYYVSGLNASDFKLTNLIIHLLIAVCLFILTKLILKAYFQRHPNSSESLITNWVSLGSTALWVLHPMNLTTVLYVVQRMTCLSALFVLLGLIAYTYGRQQNPKSKWVWICSSFFVFTPLAVLSKENGALLPVYLLLIEAIFFGFRSVSSKERWILKGIFLLAVGLPLFLIIGYTALNPSWITGGYAIRDFTLSERLMTEARVLWLYIRLIFVPDVSALGLYHDDIIVSRGPWLPWTTLPAIAGLIAIAGVSFTIRTKHPLAAFGIWFYLVGHSIESTVVSLELVHEHRNYLAMYGLLLPSVFYALSFSSKLVSFGFRKTVLLTLVIIFGSVTSIRAAQWSDLYTLHFMEVTHHPESLRANTDMAYIYAFLPSFSLAEAEERYVKAMHHYQKSYELSDNDASGLLGMIGLSSQRNRPIEEFWLKDLEQRLAEYPFSPNYGNSLMSLEKCVTQGVCKNLSPEHLDRLLRAALNNSTLYGKARGNILFSRSHLLLRSLNKPEEARKLAYTAATYMPSNLESKITFVKVLINLGELEQARRQLEKLKQEHNVDEYTAELGKLEAMTAQPPAL